MRVFILILAVLVAGALLLFDTAALIQLGWLCLPGQCGIPGLWIAVGLGALTLGCVLPGVLARLRRRRPSVRGKARPTARRKRAKP